MSYKPRPPYVPKPGRRTTLRNFEHLRPEGWEPNTPPGHLTPEESDGYGARTSYRFDIGDRNFLSDIRITSGKTCKTVGDILGVSRSAISQMQKPENDLRIGTIKRFIEACGGVTSVRVYLEEQNIEMEFVL